MSSHVRRIVAAAAVAVLAAVPLVPRAAPASGPVDDRGLIERAKAEGRLDVYGVGPANLIDAKAKRFQATYGITVTWARLGGTAIPPRLLTEQRAGRSEADVVIGESGLETEQIERSGLYAQYRPPEVRALLPGTYDPGGYWAAHQLYTETICYNPARVKAAGVKPPRSWEDLAGPGWRGQFALFSGSWEWYAALRRYYGAARTDAMMRGYVANQPRLEASHQLGVDLAAAGEVLAGANVFGYTCLLAKDKGEPIELVNPVPTVVELGTIGVLKAAPHPNAARLFERWLLSHETEQWAVDQLGETVPRRDVRNDPRILGAKVRYVISDMSDPNEVNADISAFNALFNIPM